MSDIPKLTMADGQTIPQVGFGIWQIKGDGATDAVALALDAGYPLIDGAYLYGNEAAIGAGMKKAGIARADVFITTKVWNNEQGKRAARVSVERSLREIGVDQLDLCLIHWPVPSQDRYLETWEAFIEMRDAGLMRSIGVSNFNADHLDRLIAETGVTPALNQIELHPRLQQPEMRKVNVDRGIVTQAWTPLGKGMSFEAAPIAAAAARTGKSPAQVVLRWHVQSGHAVIPRSTNPTRTRENLDIFDFSLSAAEMDAISTLDMGLRIGPDPSVFKMLDHPPQ